MAAGFALVRWTRKARALAGVLLIAGAINLILLLLIASLINCGDEPAATMPKLRPVDFIRVPPKPSEPKPVQTPAPENNIMESADPPPPKKEIRKPAAEPVKDVKPKKRPVKQRVQVAAPKLDIPLNGSGSSVAAVAGLDARLTAPPAQWQAELKPKPAEPVAKGPINRRLVVVSRVMPVYPWKAKRMNIEGWVKLEIIVATDGSVRQATVLEDQPKDTFADAAIKAIKQWRFQTAFVAGQAVEQKAVQLLEFQLR